MKDLISLISNKTWTFVEILKQFFGFICLNAECTFCIVFLVIKLKNDWVCKKCEIVFFLNVTVYECWESKVEEIFSQNCVKSWYASNTKITFQTNDIAGNVTGNGNGQRTRTLTRTIGVKMQPKPFGSKQFRLKLRNMPAVFSKIPQMHIALILNFWVYHFTKIVMIFIKSVKTL